ncbi:hypothetical protein EDEG_01747 [Edhazardia aedis USNM 41457]|uniref:Uncharacterized protein n=1 Tax=Edhazardia aedis (strain USNM 41457) TaxID=1003232 RepID=J9DN65_EDHAE|nr:hypothetical protein EDEG_01747 [Edhazardia aedis USNM 41457]|eukprot:EJW03980.1 hypothetical protein EDEG_01747 [Edhazardia aedis USNM 41457]
MLNVRQQLFFLSRKNTLKNFFENKIKIDNLKYRSDRSQMYRYKNIFLFSGFISGISKILFINFITRVSCASDTENKEFFLPRIIFDSFEGLKTKTIDMSQKNNAMLSISMSDVGPKDVFFAFLDCDYISNKIKTIFSHNIKFTLTVLSIDESNKNEKSRMLDHIYEELIKCLYQFEHGGTGANSYFNISQKQYELSQLKDVISAMIKLVSFNEISAQDENIKKYQLPVIESNNKENVSTMFFIAFEPFTRFEIENLMRMTSTKILAFNQPFYPKYFNIIGRLSNADDSLTTFQSLTENFLTFKILGTLFYYKPWLNSEKNNILGFQEVSCWISEAGASIILNEQISFIDFETICEWNNTKLECVYALNQTIAIYAKKYADNCVMITIKSIENISGNEVTILKLQEVIYECPPRYRKSCDPSYKFDKQQKDNPDIFINEISLYLMVNDHIKYSKTIRLVKLNGMYISLLSDYRRKDENKDYVDLVFCLIDVLYRSLYNQRFDGKNIFHPIIEKKKFLKHILHNEVYLKKHILSYNHTFTSVIEKTIKNGLLLFWKDQDNPEIHFYHIFYTDAFLLRHKNFEECQKYDICDEISMYFFGNDNKILVFEKNSEVSFDLMRKKIKQELKIGCMDSISLVSKCFATTIQENETRDVIIDFRITNNKRFFVYIKLISSFGLNLSINEIEEALVDKIIKDIQANHANDKLFEYTINTFEILGLQIKSLVSNIFNLLIGKSKLTIADVQDYVNDYLNLKEIENIYKSTLQKDLEQKPYFPYNAERRDSDLKSATNHNFEKKQNSIDSDEFENINILLDNIKSTLAKHVFNYLDIFSIEIKCCAYFMDEDQTTEINHILLKLIDLNF